VLKGEKQMKRKVQILSPAEPLGLWHSILPQQSSNKIKDTVGRDSVFSP
jgi:hypothetical protein